MERQILLMMMGCVLYKMRCSSTIECARARVCVCVCVCVCDVPYNMMGTVRRAVRCHWNESTPRLRQNQRMGANLRTQRRAQLLSQFEKFDVRACGYDHIMYIVIYMSRTWNGTLQCNNIKYAGLTPAA